MAQRIKRACGKDEARRCLAKKLRDRGSKRFFGGRLAEIEGGDRKRVR
jgi:hypothetical protein